MKYQNIFNGVLLGSIISLGIIQFRFMANIKEYAVATNANTHQLAKNQGKIVEQINKIKPNSLFFTEPTK